MPLSLRETFPLTHEQAVCSLLESAWSKTELAALHVVDSASIHQSIGASVRNHWYLLDSSYPLTKHYHRRFGIGCPDDMCSLILKDFLARLKRHSFSVEAEAERIRQHWIRQGVNPLTLERTA